MMEIKICGRGGQGAVLASQMLARAFFNNGLHVQAFPSFGAERRGAPVSAFLRTDSDAITLRCGVEHPDWIILLDESLMRNPMITGGTTSETSLLVNTTEPPLTENGLSVGRLCWVDATGIAEALKLKTTSFTIVNTAMVGAFAGASNHLDVQSVAEGVRALVPVKADANVAAAIKAFENVKEVSLD